MAYVNTQLQGTDTGVAASQNSNAATVSTMSRLDVTAVVAGSNPSNVAFDTGTMNIKTVTFPAKAGATVGDHVVFYDAAGDAWAIALDPAGTTAPTDSAAWTAVVAGNKVVVDISSGTDAASVAALVETAVDGLTGFTAVIATDDTAADGTMLFTQVVPGVVTDAVLLDDDATGVGSITVADATPGVVTEVDIVENSVNIPAHGLLTGVKLTELTSTGTLPAGLSTSTVYYPIVVDVDNIKFATSQANAAAGTAVDIAGYGTSAAVHTVVIATTIAGTIKIQKNNSPEDVDAVWVTVLDGSVQGAGTASYTISAAGTHNWSLPNFGARQARVVTTITSGTVTVDARLHGKP